MVKQAPPSKEQGEQLWLEGAVLVRVRGRRIAETGQTSPAPLSPELVAAIEERPTSPARELLRLLWADGVLAPSAIMGASLLASGTVVVQALLFRSFLDVGNELVSAGQRIGAIAALLVFITALLLLELPLAGSLFRCGRRLEIRLRVAFQRKIPRLGDRYFQSRLTSDMAERSHSVHRIRQLPVLGGQLLRSIFELVLTAVGVIWLDPKSAPLAAAATLAAVGLPLAGQPLLMERDLRVRNHTGALARFYLDALLGLIPIRAHGAEMAVRREHEELLLHWAAASFGLQKIAVWLQGAQLLAAFGLAAALVLNHVERAGGGGAVLLLVYWALNLPVLGEAVAQIAWQYPAYRNVALRLLEPLGALEENVESIVSRSDARAAATGAAIELEQVALRVAGHTILEDVDLYIPAGSHVAIVGPSGAGKSSLVGMLLGWHRPAAGRVLVDDFPLEGIRLEQLRRETAWVDPSVQLWNRSFLDNLVYGKGAGATRALDMALHSADLQELLERLPDGLQTRLGEGGALVSGGEGQRVRLGRALLRTGARLVILDEPFRGLDRERRRDLLKRARKLWTGVTLLCITHDVSETLAFDRVVVVEQGRVVEDDAPRELARMSDSRYRSLLVAEEAVRQTLWSGRAWRRFRLDSGEIVMHRVTKDSAI
jgi:ATP-binding cassette subfamily B protein